MKTYLDMDEVLRHCRRYIGQEYDEPYLVSAVPEEVIRSLPPADVVEVRHGRWIFDDFDGDGWDYQCSECGGYSKGSYDYCYHCGAKMDRWKMDGGQDDG